MTTFQTIDKKPLNFSIEQILNGVGTGDDVKKDKDVGVPQTYSIASWPWMHCTRYCPPRIPRKKETSQKRQLGRHPRIPFTAHQLTVLEENYQKSPYLSSQEVKEVAAKLDLTDIRVKIWFQNRRARERKERLIEQAKNFDDSNVDYDGKSETTY